MASHDGRYPDHIDSVFSINIPISKDYLGKPLPKFFKENSEERLEPRGVPIDTWTQLHLAGESRREARRIASEAIVNLVTKSPGASVRITPEPPITWRDAPVKDWEIARDSRDMINHPLAIEGTPEGIIAFAKELEAQLAAEAAQKKELGHITLGLEIPRDFLNPVITQSKDPKNYQTTYLI